MQRGTLVAGRFEIECFAGAGGMGRVYRAYDHETGEPVALKLEQPGLDAETADRFEAEAEILATLCAPGIVRYIDHGVLPAGDRYLVMEWLDGEDLAARLSRGRLDIGECVDLALRVVDALGVVHARGIVHRDLKPQNIFLRGGVIADAKVIDFGIARLVHGPSVTLSGVILGTLAYLAPEQARADRGIDGRADVFALGAVLFECLTGAPAFAGRGMMQVLAKIVFAEVPRASTLRAEIPQALDLLVARMLAKDPAARPAGCVEVARALAALDEKEVTARAEGVASLGRAEQRLLGVVLAAGEPAASFSALQTLTPDDQEVEWEVLEQAAEGFGARFALLLDGTVAVTLIGAEAASDLAARAARCALVMRGLLPRRPMALAMGRGELGGNLPAGEVIERAAGLLGAVEGMVAVDDVTAGLLDARFEVVERALICERTGADDVRRLLGKLTPCVGRVRELSALSALFDECLGESMARAVLVIGEPGAGKSRLRHEFVQRIRGRAGQIWTARGDPMRAGAPFELLGQWVRQAATIQAGEPIEVRRDKLVSRVARHVGVAERARVAEFLGEMAGTPFLDEDRTELRAARQNAILMGDQIRRAWADFIEAECRAEPVLLVLEDLHWGDLSTVTCVDTAMRLCRSCPLAVLALARPEVTELFPDLWAERGVDVMRLGPLSPRACEALARQVLGVAIPESVVAAIVERSHGNAFFLEELVRAEAEGRGSDAPATVLAMAQARLETLAPEARRLLRAASVFGEIFWCGALATLLGVAPAELEALLTMLEEREWIAPRREARFQGEREYAFRHALVREAALGMLTDTDRVLGHRLAGAWLERAGEREALGVAEHFEMGRAPTRAVGWYRRAAEQALEGNDLGAVIARVERGLACGAAAEARGELLRLRAEAHDWRGEYDAAERWAMEAMQSLPVGSATWYAAEHAAVWAAGVQGDWPRVATLAALVDAAWSDEAVSAQQMNAALWTAAWLRFGSRHDTARALHARAEALADGFRDDPAVGAALASVQGILATFSGDVSRACDQTKLAIRRFEQAGDQRNACRERGSLGDALRRLGAHAEAVVVLRQALADAERMGLSTSIHSAMGNLGQVLAALGCLGEARAMTVEAIVRFSTQGDRRQAGVARVYLAAILRLCDDFDGAEAEARRALIELRDIETLQPFALATLAEVLLARGHEVEALAAARRAAELMTALGEIEEGEALVRLMLVEALAANGEPSASAESLGAAHAHLLRHADTIADPAMRASFLHGVPENARTLALWEQGPGAARG